MYYRNVRIERGRFCKLSLTSNISHNYLLLGNSFWFKWHNLEKYYIGVVNILGTVDFLVNLSDQKISSHNILRLRKSLVGSITFRLLPISAIWTFGSKWSTGLNHINVLDFSRRGMLLNCRCKTVISSAILCILFELPHNTFVICHFFLWLVFWAIPGHSSAYRTNMFDITFNSPTTYHSCSFYQNPGLPLTIELRNLF